MAASSRSLVVVGVLLAVLTACSLVSPPPEPTPSGSPSPTPDYPALTQAVEDHIASGSLSLGTIQAVLVSVDGRTVVEDYRNGSGPEDWYHLWSVTKSVTSALIGIAVGEGLIGGLDEPLADLLPEYRSSMDARRRAISLRQLMTMSAGITPDGLAPYRGIHDVFSYRGDAVELILRRPLATAPGAVFDYSSSSSHLVTAVLASALRRSPRPVPRTVLAYAQDRLLGPLGVPVEPAFSAPVDLDRPPPAFFRAGFGWGTDRAGLASGCCLLRLRPVDLVHFGELYVGDGVWHGRRILPAGWARPGRASSSARRRRGTG